LPHNLFMTPRSPLRGHLIYSRYSKRLANDVHYNHASKELSLEGQNFWVFLYTHSLTSSQQIWHINRSKLWFFTYLQGTDWHAIYTWLRWNCLPFTNLPALFGVLF